MFGIFKQKPRRAVAVAAPVGRKRGRPTREMQAERRRQALLDAKSQLELKRLQLELAKMDAPGDDEPVTLEKLQRLQAALRPLGLEIRPKNASGGDEGGFAGIVRALADSPMGEALGASLGAALPRALGLPAGGFAIPQLAPAAASLEPPIADVSPSSVTGEALAAQTAAPPSSPSSPSLSAPSEAAASAAAGGQYDFLAGYSPPAAAQMLLNHSDAGVRSWVRMLQASTAEGVWTVLEEFAAANPDRREFVDWLKAHRDWTNATMAELRTVAAAQKNGVGPESRDR